jgi:predicted DCC family thiol-disulfide oxidoreductase YuxK
MSTLTLLYDPTCGLCRRVHGWLAEQPKLIELRMIPIKTEAARRRYPQLNHDLTGEDLTAISDEGAVYFGPKAWLMVLWPVIANGLTVWRHLSCCRPRGELCL